MNLNMIIEVVAYIVVVGLAGYQLYKSIQRFMSHTSARKEFLEMNREKLDEEFLEHQMWVAIYSAAALGLFVLGGYFFITSTDYLYATACVSLALIMMGYVMDCFVTRRSWYYETGFFFEAKFYRYRSLAHIGKRKGIFPTYDVRFHALPDMVVTKNMGIKLQEKEVQWKAAKKEKKKTGDK